MSAKDTRIKVLRVERGRGWPIAACALCKEEKECAFAIVETHTRRSRTPGVVRRVAVATPHLACGACVAKSPLTELVIISIDDVELDDAAMAFLDPVGDRPDTPRPTWDNYHDRLLEGLTMTAIADLYGVTRQRIQSAFRQAHTKGEMSDAQYEQMRQINWARTHRTGQMPRQWLQPASSTTE